MESVDLDGDEAIEDVGQQDLAVHLLVLEVGREVVEPLALAVLLREELVPVHAFHVEDRVSV